MSRILKRPMFRRGGSTNDGIMTGIVDREKKAEGTLQPRIEEILAAMQQYAPLEKAKFPLGQLGLNLASGQFAGDGLLQNIIGSAKGPYAQFVKADDARKAAQAKRKASAVATALTEQSSMKLALQKAALKGDKIAVEKLIDLAIKSGEFPDTPEGRSAAFKIYSKSTSDYLRESTEQKIQDERSLLARTDTTATEQQAEYNVLSRDGKIPIKGEDYGVIDPTYDAKLITENEEFGPGDGFFNVSDGKFYTLKAGGNKADFTSNSYNIITLRSLY